MSPSPSAPRRARVFQKRMRVLIMSLVQTGEQRNAPRGRSETEPRRVVGHPYYGRTPFLPLYGFCIPLCYYSLFRVLASFPFFISASRLCLTSVAKFFRPATIIAPRRSRRDGGGKQDSVCGSAFAGDAAYLHTHTHTYTRRVAIREKSSSSAARSE